MAPVSPAAAGDATRPVVGSGGLRHETLSFMASLRDADRVRAAKRLRSRSPSPPGGGGYACEGDATRAVSGSPSTTRGNFPREESAAGGTPEAFALLGASIAKAQWELANVRRTPPPKRVSSAPATRSRMIGGTGTGGGGLGASGNMSLSMSADIRSLADCNASCGTPLTANMCVSPSSHGGGAAMAPAYELPSLLQTPVGFRKDLIQCTEHGFVANSPSPVVGEAVSVLNEMRAVYLSRPGSASGVGSGGGDTAHTTPPPQRCLAAEEPTMTTATTPPPAVGGASNPATSFTIPGERIEQRLRKRWLLRQQQAQDNDQPVPPMPRGLTHAEKKEDPFTISDGVDPEDAQRTKKIQIQAAVSRLLRGLPVIDSSDDAVQTDDVAAAATAAAAASPMASPCSLASGFGGGRPPPLGGGGVLGRYDGLDTTGLVDLQSASVSLSDAKRMISTLIEEINILHGRYRGRLRDANAKYQDTLLQSTDLIEELDRCRSSKSETELTLSERASTLQKAADQLKEEKRDLVRLTDAIRESAEAADQKAEDAARKLAEMTEERDKYEAKAEKLKMELQDKKQLIEQAERRRATKHAELLQKIADLEGVIQTQKITFRRLVRVEAEKAAGERLQRELHKTDGLAEVVRRLETHAMREQDRDAVKPPPSPPPLHQGQRLALHPLPSSVGSQGLEPRRTPRGTVLGTPRGTPREDGLNPYRRSSSSGWRLAPANFAPLDFTMITMPITDLDAKGMALGHPLRRTVQGLGDAYAVGWNDLLERMKSWWHCWRAIAPTEANALKMFDELKAAAHALLKDTLAAVERQRLKFLLKLVRAVTDAVPRSGSLPGGSAPLTRRQSFTSLRRGSSMRRSVSIDGAPPHMQESPIMTMAGRRRGSVTSITSGGVSDEGTGGASSSRSGRGATAALARKQSKVSPARRRASVSPSKRRQSTAAVRSSPALPKRKQTSAGLGSPSSTASSTPSPPPVLKRRASHGGALLQRRASISPVAMGGGRGAAGVGKPPSPSRAAATSSPSPAPLRRSISSPPARPAGATGVTFALGVAGDAGSRAGTGDNDTDALPHADSGVLTLSSSSMAFSPMTPFTPGVARGGGGGENSDAAGHEHPAVATGGGVLAKNDSAWDISAPSEFYTARGAAVPAAAAPPGKPPPVDVASQSQESPSQSRRGSASDVDDNAVDPASPSAIFLKSGFADED